VISQENQRSPELTASSRNKNPIRNKEVREYLLTTGKGKMADVVDRVVRFHRANISPILLIGESGSGKEFLARVLLSNGRDFRTVDMRAFNCGGTHEEMILSDLFGHKKGAFTGALRDREGILRAAKKGVFLDEIDKSGTRLQHALLRYIRNGELWVLGADEPIPAKVKQKLVFATSAKPEHLFSDLLERIDQARLEEFVELDDRDAVAHRLQERRDELKKHLGEVRAELSSDFLSRIISFAILIPPLRDRREDFGLLVPFFIKKACQEMGTKVSHISGEVLDFVCRYIWPNNIAELENFLRMGVLYREQHDKQKNVVTISGCLRLYTGLFDFQHPTNDDLDLPEWRQTSRRFTYGYLGIGEDSRYAKAFGYPDLITDEATSPECFIFRLNQLERILNNVIVMRDLDDFENATDDVALLMSRLTKPPSGFDKDRMLRYFRLLAEEKQKTNIFKKMGFGSRTALNTWLSNNYINH